jgi:bifunctional enzyme CysN/CysC
MRGRWRQIKNFTGVDSPYEAPESAEIHLKTSGKTPDEMVETIERWLLSREAEADFGAGI